ncbi:MAG: hypothetical protein INQ03_15680 [Candidatus Heimdallarchaeota archaeon]|nr:hypothetical protein [Candidatus Heimdallarchaeota archaeon]
MDIVPCFNCDTVTDDKISIYCKQCYQEIDSNAYSKIRTDREDELLSTYSYNILLRLLLLAIFIGSFKLLLEYINWMVAVFGSPVVLYIVHRKLRVLLIKRRLNLDLPRPINLKEVEQVEFTKKREIPDRIKQADTDFMSLIADVHKKHISEENEP